MFIYLCQVSRLFTHGWANLATAEPLRSVLSRRTAVASSVYDLSLPLRKQSTNPWGILIEILSTLRLIVLRSGLQRSWCGLLSSGFLGWGFVTVPFWFPEQPRLCRSWSSGWISVLRLLHRRVSWTDHINDGTLLRWIYLAFLLMTVASILLFLIFTPAFFFFALLPFRLFLFYWVYNNHVVMGCFSFQYSEWKALVSYHSWSGPSLLTGG